jgi:hypothetical protein
MGTLLVPLPLGLALGARYGIHWFVLGALLLWTCSFSLPDRWADGAALATTLALFGLSLAALWRTGISEPTVVGGLLPWSDASGYYYDARRLNLGFTFSEFSARRPLFAGWLAFLLALTGDNLKWSLAILVAINAVACFLLARAVRETEGTVAGVITALIVFLFYRRFAGTTLTENAGVALGTLGVAVLWRWAAAASAAPLALGVFLTTLALNARAGAFFVLPSLLLWMAWRSRRAYKRALIGCASALGCVALAFGVNGLLGRLLAGGHGQAFSNFSWTLYGQAVGGKGWGQILVDHPELREISDPELSRRIYHFALAAIRERPWLLVRAAGKALRDFVDPDPRRSYLFSFIRSPEMAMSQWMGCVLIGVAIFALAVALRRHREHRYTLLLFGVAGVILSVPFVPPVDADWMRAYAASLPLLAVLLGVGGGAIAARLPFPPKNTMERRDHPGALLGASAALLLLTVGAVSLRVLRRSVSPSEPVRCAAGQAGVAVPVSPGSYIHLASDVDGERTSVPRVRRSDFIAGLQNLGYPDVARELGRLPEGSVTANTFDVRTGEYVWLEWTRPDWRRQTRVITVCGSFTPDASVRLYGFFRADGEAGRISDKARGATRWSASRRGMSPSEWNRVVREQATGSTVELAFHP